ncbi:hypothetical protein JCM5296_004861 [Sporobolomyces johnsonii]
MESPVNDIRNVVRELCEPAKASDMLSAVDKYFASDSQIIYPLLNSPKGAGIEGVKSAYKMLRVLTYDNKASLRWAPLARIPNPDCTSTQIDFHVVAFDRITVKKGVEYQSGVLDLTEHLKFKFIPLPDRFNPTFHIRFISRIDLRKDPQTELWQILKQEDNLPNDFGSTGLHFLPFDRQIADTIKWGTGVGTLVVGGALSRLNLF